MEHHNFVIPGFDRSYCQRCRKWICSPAELERLKKALGKKDKDGDRLLLLEEGRMKRCGGS